MFWINVKRVLKSGFFSFIRNGFVSLSSILVMIVTLSVICGLIFLSAILNSSLDQVKNKVDVNVYFVTNANEDDILSLKKSVEALLEVEKVAYISRDQALNDFKERHKNDEFTLQALDELSDNPLGAVLNIKAKDPSQYEGIANFLQKAGFEIIESTRFQKDKTSIPWLQVLAGKNS